MPERNNEEQEFDIRWADTAEYKEPSARARMLAARWRDNPPGPVPFRGEPGRGTPRRSRSPWVSAVVVLGCVAAVIVFLGFVGFSPR